MANTVPKKRKTNEMDFDQDAFSREGFVIIRDCFDQAAIDGTQGFLDSHQSSFCQRFHNCAWGYGDVSDNLPGKLVKECEPITRIAKDLFPEGYDWGHIAVNEKSAFVGFEVEWHQEMANVNTFAPGNYAEDSNFFVQIFIALDEQGASNGGLTLYPRSHSLGLLDHIDILSPALTHKRSLTLGSLELIDDHCDAFIPNLRSGDCIIFNSLLVHSSVRNNSGRRRRSVICQIRSANRNEFDRDIFEKEREHRTSFITKILTSVIAQNNHTDRYLDITKTK